MNIPEKKGEEVVRIIAQGQFDVNEENIGGAVFWPGYREHDGFFLRDEQLASLNEDRSMDRNPL